jgi:drug/metabolite transporter (DMT)-like permease
MVGVCDTPLRKNYQTMLNQKINPKPTVIDYLTLHFVILIFGFTAVLGKLISVHTLGLIFFRTFLATLGFYIYFKIKDLSIKIDSKGKWQLLGTGGIIIALHWFTFFYSAYISTVAISLTGLSTTSFWTSLIEPLWNKKRINFIEVMLGGVVILGLYLIFLFEFNHIWGLCLSILCAILGAIFSVMNGQYAKQYSPQIITFYEMMGAAITTSIPVLYILLTGNDAIKVIPQGLDWLWILILAFACTIYAYTESVNLVRIFSAYTFNLTLNLEPVYGILLAYSILGQKERMTSGFYVGTLVILGSVLVYPLLQKKENIQIP